ncbi:Cytochrome P450 714C2 [Vitis vinifera]|uniref:Cytochrome P450 714C2 n=1 Tax=Vitis vinifera TaxID=29760 RepID=A0A438HY90_VITVI|nr:Cytochrome P450 714C2 [Vitis vinifera]
MYCYMDYFVYMAWQCSVSRAQQHPAQASKARDQRSPPAFVMGNIPEMKRIMSMAADAPRSEAHLPLDFPLPLPSLISLSGLSYMKDRGPLLGKGLITSNGAVWFHQRKTIAPQLFMDKVKGNLNIMVESASNLVSSWLGLIELGSGSGCADIRVDDYIRSFTSTVISKMMFGSHHSKAVELFPKCRALMKNLQTPTILKGIPFFRYLPTKENRDVWRLEREIHASLIDIVKENPEAASDKMAQIIMESAKTGELGPSTLDQYIVDNCKDVYLAGFEVTAVATLWGLVLLASNPEWQARLRAEIFEVCGGHVPDTNMLGKMKLLKMVIQEVLRLYPGVAFVSRQTLKDVKLGDILVPKGVNIWIWIPALHQDPELWGSDAEKFNPERFANGISGACKSPNAYIPFGVGTRMCPGQNLAITEMKILFTIILSHFSLSISPNYLHSPRLNLLLEPEYGVNLIIRKI